MSRFTHQRLAPFIAQHSKDDLLALKELIETGKVKPVIDRTYPLSEVPEAIRYLERDTPVARSSSRCELWRACVDR
jgi:NADPH:quinone reductase-like Zn-dependent oxidoreductase